MLPAEWIRQAEWTKMTNIIFFLNTVKEFNVRICNPTIFILHTLGVKFVFISEMSVLKYVRSL